MALSSTLFILGSLAAFLQPSNCQNQPPEWVHESYQPLKDGISEDTPRDTVVATLRCTDAEGDQIFYKLETGDAFTVRADGRVILAKELDFEGGDAGGLDMSVSCIDYGEKEANREEWVEVRFEYAINDANDHPPTFTTTSVEGYYFEISENASVSTSLTPSLTVRDADSGLNARLRELYFICDSTDPTVLAGLTETGKETCDKFSINYVQLDQGLYRATVVLEKELDYEIQPVYQSQLVAVDGDGNVPSLTSSINIQFQIQDAQDTPPEFTNSGESTTVEENIKGETLPDFGVSARDGDTGARRRVEFEIIQDLENIFELTTSELVQDSLEVGVYSSKLIVRNILDREKIPDAYLFVVKAYEMDDTTSPPSRTDDTSTATYSVFVSDVNDNPPLFSPQVYEINVTEFTSHIIEDEANYQPVQIAGLHITCEDKDEPSNSQYTVTIKSQRYPNAYSVSPSGTTFVGKGSMFLQVDTPNYLDYDVEEYRVQTIVLEAKEINTIQQFSSSATISLFLVDVNDNTPKFDLAEYVWTISESVGVFPYTIETVTATDDDSGPNGEIRYSLQGGVSDKFKIDAVSGEITLENAVDYEQIQQYVFLVHARDQGTFPKSSQVQVTVNILNFNDQGPKFQQPDYQTAADESSLTFLNPITVVAVDPEDDNAQITYRILSGQSENDAFLINRFTGELTLIEYLDYQQTEQDSQGNRLGHFTLLVEASDNGSPPQTNDVTVLVNVIDENNHSPVVDPRSYYKRLSEIASPGTVVADVEATDNDGGTFGRITYRLGPGNSGNFRVSPSSGVVTVAEETNFDFHQKSAYTLLILATDGGAPQRTATATVSVDLVDANNKPPAFPKYLYKTNVDEDTPVDTSVLKVEAFDEDDSADIVYTILRDLIVASDGNGNQLSASSSYNYRDAFRIEESGQNRGIIYVNGELNKAIAQEISFDIIAEDLNSDTGGQTASTEVTIIIKGDPEERIAFDPQADAFFNEEEDVDYDVATFIARDLKYDQLIENYEKLSGSSSYLKLDSVTGKVRLAKRVDYESGPLEHLMIVRAIASDGVRSATGTITASVLDNNDNRPIFQRPSYEVELSESALFPDFVARIQASDRDSSSYGPITYHITGGLDAEDFTIFQASNDPGAEVLVAENKELNYNIRSVYVLNIVAVDNPTMLASSTRKTSDVTLTIHLIDENNNTPYFKDASPSFVVPETADIGQDIAVLQAFDDDRGRNGEISYSLEAGQGPNGFDALSLFGISSSNGNIYVISSLLGKGGIKYFFTVRARDKGTNPNSALLNVEVTVLSTEDDDGNPKWNAPAVNYVALAPEETPGYQLTGLMDKFDVIPRTGTQITFALSVFSEGYSNFSIDSLTGLITVRDSLDREIKETYELHVYAQDTNDTLKLRTGRSFIVKLTDKNDNDATFTNPRGYASCDTGISQPLVVTVTENTPAYSDIYLLQACEPDDQGHNEVVYSFYNEDLYCKENNNLNVFDIQSDGHITTNQIIDYEQRDEYILCVQVKSVIPVITSRKKRSFEWNDMNTPIRDDVAYIVIKVLDVNDHGPEFPSPTAVAVVPTSPGIGLVHQLDAVDKDGQDFSTTLYLIERSVFYPGNGGPAVLIREAFEIRGNTGAIFPKQSSYLPFVKGHFVLNIVAIDSVNNTRTDSQRVAIYVYEKGLTLKLVLGQQPGTGIDYAEELIQALDDVDDRYKLSYISASENRYHDGVNLGRTDVCFVAVDSSAQIVLDIRQVISLMNQNAYQTVLRVDKYKVEDRGKCHPSSSSEDDVEWDDLWWVLVAVAIFVFVCCIICLILVCILYRNYKRYMETRKTYLVQQ